MVPHELGLLWVSMRFERRYIVHCRIAALHSVGIPLCKASTLIGRDRVGLNYH